MEKFAIGIDLGGTRVKIGLILGDELIAKTIIPARSSEGLAASLPAIETTISSMLFSQNVPASLFGGIGLGFPGLVDPKQKKILSTNKKYDDALEIDLQQWAADKWNVPLFIDNDARMAAVGEWKYGAGKGTDNLVVITIGTGIGTSAIIEGKLLRGKHFQAGCLGGHLSVDYKGAVCTCGNVGCMEAHAATWSIKQRVAESAGYSGSTLSAAEVIDFESLFKEAKNNDQLAQQIKEDCLEVWAAGIVNLIHAYDPEVVVIGGGVLNNRDEVMPYLIDKVKQHAWCPWGTVDIRPTSLLSDAGIFGAVHCLLNDI
jgi:glucokinase